MYVLKITLVYFTLFMLFVSRDVYSTQQYGVFDQEEDFYKAIEKSMGKKENPNLSDQEVKALEKKSTELYDLLMQYVKEQLETLEENKLPSYKEYESNLTTPIK